MKPIIINLTASTALQEAKRLIKYGGDCNSYEVYQAICELLGPGKRIKRIKIQRKEKDGSVSEFSYHTFWCAIGYNFAVRPE